MTLDILATGSSGNCYILTDSDGQVLILDVGIKFERIMNGIDFKLNNIEGICVTHEHKDHSLSADRFKRMGILIADKPGIYSFGNFKVRTFDLVHDVPCIGFYISHKEIGSMVYLTDTEYCKYRFPNINHILVECNYDKDLLSGEHPAKEHILTGHMELQTVKDFIKANKTNELKTVILCHMSRENLDCQKAHESIKEIFNNTYLAYIGERITL